MTNLPADPDYLSTHEIDRIVWAIKFGGVLPPLGLKYGLPDDLLEEVATHTAFLTIFKTNYDNSKTFMKGLTGNKNSLLVVNPSNLNLTVTLSTLPVFTAWPAGPIKVGILRPFLQAAELLLANVELTEADRTTAGLDKVAATVTTRPKAENFNYPLMSYTIASDVITLRIKRGDIFRGKICRIMLDPTGSGNFGLLTNTTAATVDIPVHIPTGKIASTMVIQAIYKNGETSISDWSPWLVIPVQKSNAPEEGAG